MSSNVLGGTAAISRNNRTIESGTAWMRRRETITPSPTINTNGTALTVGPDASAAYLVPSDLALKASGVASETLTVTATFTLSDQSTQTATTTFTTNIAKQFLANDAMNGNGVIGAGALPVIQVAYQVKSSIANSAARVLVDAVLMEKSFDV